MDSGNATKFCSLGGNGASPCCLAHWTQEAKLHRLGVSRTALGVAQPRTGRYAYLNCRRRLEKSNADTSPASGGRQLSVVHGRNAHGFTGVAGIRTRHHTPGGCPRNTKCTELCGRRNRLWSIGWKGNTSWIVDVTSPVTLTTHRNLPWGGSRDVVRFSACRGDEFTRVPPDLWVLDFSVQRVADALRNHLEERLCFVACRSTVDDYRFWPIRRLTPGRRGCKC